MTDGLSFLICTYNGAERLPDVLAHLADQQNPGRVPWEVIVVDNASTDDTARVAQESWSRKDISLRVVREPQPGLSFARVTALKEARYSIVSFIDDDNWAPPGWLCGVMEIMAKNPTVGACGGYITPVFGKEPPPPWFEIAKERYSISTDSRAQGIVDKESDFLAGAGLTLRKVAWNQLQNGGFHFRSIDRRENELTSGGDAELCLALRLGGWDLWFDYSLVLEHFLPDHRLQWKYARRLYRGCASCAAILDAYHHVLTSGVPPRDRLDSFRKTGGGRWIWHAASALRRLLLNPRALLDSLTQPAGDNLKVLEIEMNVGRLLSYLHHRGEYDRTVQELTMAPWRDARESAGSMLLSSACRLGDHDLSESGTLLPGSHRER